MHFTKNHNHNNNNNSHIKSTTFKIFKNHSIQNERIIAIKYTNAGSLLKWE